MPEDPASSGTVDRVSSEPVDNPRPVKVSGAAQSPDHLVIDGVVSGYHGGPPVLRGVSLTAKHGEIVAVLGRNGAGKTTLLRTISGLVGLRGGRITVDGRDLRRMSVHAIARQGIGHVPEGRRVIPSMSVIDNLKLGGYTVRSKSELNDRLGRTFEMLPMLAQWKSRIGGTLSGGEQQLLSIARALMGAPTIILLDEPLTGLAPAARALVLDVLQRIRTSGTTLVIVEQNVAETLPVADRALIIDGGAVVLEGPAEHLMGDPKVRARFFGIEMATHTAS